MASSDLDAFAMVLAGGEGKRLAPLTADRAKPAVPFGGNYRIIDFVLSNLVNAGYCKIAVLTQYKSHSLDRHINLTWRMSQMTGNYVLSVPAQMRRGPRWYLGSADALYQNFNLISDERPRSILVFGADHIYRMDPRQMVKEHLQSGAGLTVAALRVPREQADQFGVIEADLSGRITAFKEKPKQAEGLPDAPDQVYASMGNYCFTTEALMGAVAADAADERSKHDVGGDLVPAFVNKGDAHVYDFSSNHVPGSTERDRGYWRDVGTLDAYFDAHMDLISVHPIFNLYNRQWPILTWHPPLPPAKFVHNSGDRVGRAVESLVAEGVIVSGGDVRRSVLSSGVVVHSYAEVTGSVLMQGVDVGEHAIVRNAIVDKQVRIADGAQIGVDHEADRERFTITSNGVVVIGKGERVEV
ncbi:MAG: glucose-1-phosphate adenylyltransferase [Nitriliruptorales bacterium]|nr:glucose-1-phosphate adenylyltransferase [Nitriliruptorales bacterium]